MALTKALRLAASGDTVSVSKVALSAVSSHTIVRPKYPSGAFRSNQFCAPKNSSKNGGKGYRHTTGSATPAPARTRGSRAATGKPVAKTGKKASRSATPKRGKRS